MNANEILLTQIVPINLHGSLEFAAIVSERLEQYFDKFADVLGKLPVVEGEQAEPRGMPGVSGLNLDGDVDPILAWIGREEPTGAMRPQVTLVQLMLTMTTKQGELLRQSGALQQMSCHICGASVYVSHAALERATARATEEHMPTPFIYCLTDTALLMTLTHVLGGQPGVSARQE